MSRWIDEDAFEAIEVERCEAPIPATDVRGCPFNYDGIRCNAMMRPLAGPVGRFPEWCPMREEEGEGVIVRPRP